MFIAQNIYIYTHVNIHSMYIHIRTMCIHICERQNRREWLNFLLDDSHMFLCILLHANFDHEIICSFISAFVESLIHSFCSISFCFHGFKFYIVLYLGFTLSFSSLHVMLISLLCHFVSYFSTIHVFNLHSCIHSSIHPN